MLYVSHSGSTNGSIQHFSYTRYKSHNWWVDICHVTSFFFAELQHFLWKYFFPKHAGDTIWFISVSMKSLVSKIVSKLHFGFKHYNVFIFSDTIKPNSAIQMSWVITFERHKQGPAHIRLQFTSKEHVPTSCCPSTCRIFQLSSKHVKILQIKCHQQTFLRQRPVNCTPYKAELALRCLLWQVNKTHWYAEHFWKAR